ncbi:MAG: MerR family transcriptional regulator [Actinomycetaceae bacterium]|nr:MerR family transcriptional regulator [Actinomycetaceae bacterium]
MRIKELADLAGTSVRTIRHYHHIGLLPIPPTSSGRRDYGTAHLARLLRIRWLARSGLSLTQIGTLLSNDAPLNREQALEELRQTAQSIDEHIEGLVAQRNQIGELIETVARGEPLSPLPSGIGRFYDGVESQLQDPQAHDIIAVERAMVLALHSHGLLPDSVDSLLEAVTPQFQRDAARLFKDFNALTQLSADEAAQPIAELVEKSMELAAQCEPQMLAILDDVATYDHREAVLAMLTKISFFGYPHPNQREFVRALIMRFLAHPTFGKAMFDIADADLRSAFTGESELGHTAATERMTVSNEPHRHDPTARHPTSGDRDHAPPVGERPNR